MPMPRHSGAFHPDAPVEEKVLSDDIQWIDAREWRRMNTPSSQPKPPPDRSACLEVMRAVIKANGARELVWWCQTHERVEGSVRRWEKDPALHDEGYTSATQVPVIHGNRNNPRLPLCERCGSRGVEEHHWAPHHLFDDSWDWPTSFLCRDCHMRWHRIITPNMGKK
jgi:hypothetical protein